MIKLTQVSLKSGQAVLVFSYAEAAVGDEEPVPVTVEVPEDQVRSRLKSLQAITGLKPTLADLKIVIINLVKEIQSGKTKFPQVFDYTSFIGVDLEKAV